MQHIRHNSNCWTVQLFCCFTTQGQDCCLSVIMITQRVFVTTHTHKHTHKEAKKAAPEDFHCVLPTEWAVCLPHSQCKELKNQESVRDILGSPDSWRNDFELRMSGVYRWDSFVRVHYSKNKNNSKSKQSKLSTDTQTDTHIHSDCCESSSNSLNDFKFEVWVILQVKSRRHKLWQKFN